MPPRTTHRLQEAADLCKQHLREKHSDQGVLVEEFIMEFEGREMHHPVKAKENG